MTILDFQIETSPSQMTPNLTIAVRPPPIGLPR